MNSLVFSSYTNAFAIYKGAKKLGINVSTVEKNPTFPIRSEYESKQADWLFFTEESSLRRALTGELKGSFSPANFPIQLLDDKWAFVEWLGRQADLTGGIRQWPLSSLGQVTYPCVLKAKHSWVEGLKLPRGWICRTPDELKESIRNLGRQGFNHDHFFIQKWLGDEECRVVSVCGFHDSSNDERNLTATVERIASHNEGLSCSAAVETIDDQWSLQTKTTQILKALDFIGPYELEYLVSNRMIAVLELNPRFWMQHAIFLPAGNGLIKRYLGLETATDRTVKQALPIVWIDGLHLVGTLATLRPEFFLFTLKYLFTKNKKLLIWPALPMAIYVWAKVAFYRLFEDKRKLS